MSKVANPTRNGTGQRELSALAAERPELAPWLRPLGVALAALATEPWRNLTPLCAPTRAAGVPVLHDAIIPVEQSLARAHVGAVLAAAFNVGATEFGRLDGAALLESAIAFDDERIGAMGAELGFDAAALGAAAQLAALPVLQACTGAVAASPAMHWPHGYCHVCGALPTLAEVLGLERARHLRCGRCGAAWRTEVLLCPFCGERDHARLGSLVPEGADGQICWVETCTSCRGYVKTRAVLRSAPGETLLISDARTVELDLAAEERGFTRPNRAGFRVCVRLSPVSVAVS